MTGATTEFCDDDSTPQVSGTEDTEINGPSSEDTQRPLSVLAKQMANFGDIEVC